ncbi:Putative SOS response-associated peptidase YedK [Jatrophihabitans endophyticus]|uniref:Abasic site processing protein n=1 Tax=Jatrophihabitans endophyticus TaxID=1206085 RepID=A0A1M5EAU7_9ACTN|nr:SOS response-associated peptidase [Jatrophihabitans endophyticus]SHF76348.1 Putative SOS response-associated peptidase YedK [Jatrophihabitans endophyticus]
MCGRYVSVRSDDDLTDEFDAVDATDGLWPEGDFNIAPTKPVRVVVNRPLRDAEGNAAKEATRQLRVVSWGLIPSWSRDRKTQGRMFNARAESVARTNAFRKAYASRRCLVPADGWYEWRRVDAADGVRKQPMYMTPADGHPIAFAGLYEFWHDPAATDAPTVTTCTIVTVDSSGDLADIHDRMPLVLARASWERWLDPSVADPADLLRTWDEADGEHLELRPVSPLVNKVDNNGPELLAEAEPEVEEQRLF